MYVIEVKTGKHFKIEISPVEPHEYKLILKKNFFFNWKLEKDFHVYKINIKDQSKILGLVSFELIPEEWRIHIRLITVSIENKGKDKLYERIIGNLLTYISKISIKEFAELACVSLKPKGVIAKHYIDKYGMNVTGATLSLELPEIIELIKIYEDEK